MYGTIENQQQPIIYSHTHSTFGLKGEYAERISNDLELCPVQWISIRKVEKKLRGKIWTLTASESTIVLTSAEFTL
jgi:hypothetical protein